MPSIQSVTTMIFFVFFHKNNSNK